MSFLPILSALFGWIYTTLWSASFFPQPLLNWRRRTTAGSNIDFPAVNVVGFAAYLLYNLAFLFSSDIQEQYALRHNGDPPTVEWNDLAFAAAAVICSIIVISQFVPSLWGFKKLDDSSHEVHVSNTIKGVIVGSFVGVAAVAAIVEFAPQQDGPQGGAEKGWAAIDVVYALSFVKVIVTLIKYTPQVITNHRNKSTEGWSILQIIFDFTGGVLSLLQLCIDSYLIGNWSGITGNPVKLALGQISIFYDVIFMVQHYLLYADSRKAREAAADAERGSDEERPLIGNGRHREY